MDIGLIFAWVMVYAMGAIATLIIAGMIAETETGKVRKWWNTIAALWLIWPLAWVGGVAYAIVYGCVTVTRFFWQERNK